ncbi:integrator complex subunit 11 isoform X2 [Echeneis naucrates]|uniref:integrator complex subunit 11 isoform X2 n=1 Tax=Echeneis naucrates TaxID=173247 RepID=UPI001114243E|nr:integrator complex subunit 11 isoform X2 [Echeneis naucrates]
MPEIKVTPLGAGQDVGRSCILVSIGGKNIMLDCGMHMGYNDDVDDELEIKAYYAGHVLGAAMVHIKVGSESVVYTGDYNMTPDRHLGAAWIDKCRPDILISESTYATTIRDSKRCRERDFLKKVHESIERGGKVLIPVFALGRAQELCILLETFWERMNLKAPIYFSTGLTEKANHYYKLFITWTNQKIRKTFVQRNMFEFKHIKAFDRSYADNPGPMVVFATPGMLHAGQSLQIFKKWAGNEKNMVIMPGYCVQGTIGHKILNGQRKLEMEGRATLDVKLQVEYMSFSAHADAKGIMQLIRMAEPRNMVLVHGEAVKMEFLKGKIEQEFSIDCYMPANGETVTVTTNPSVPVDISLNLLKREMALGGPLPDPKKPRTMHGTLIMKENSLKLVSSEQALKELGLNEHQLRFTCRVQLQDPHSDPDTLHRIYTHLKSVLKGYTIQHLPDGTVMVESIVIKVSSSAEDPNTKVLLLSWSYQDEDLGSFLSTLLKKGLPSGLC